MNISKATFFGTVESGKLKLANRQELDMYISLCSGEIMITISKRKKPRSLPQNNYYWGVIIPILGNHFGYNSNEMHDALKWLFLRQESVGKPMTIKSTTDLSTIDFEDYASNIRKWASEEFQVFLPLPNEDLEFNY